jgi:hypothetical protein
VQRQTLHSRFVFRAYEVSDPVAPTLKKRLIRVAHQVQVLRHYKELVEKMAELSDAWNASAADMKKGLDSGNIDLLSRSILANMEHAKRMNFVLQRYERIVNKMTEASQE